MSRVFDAYARYYDLLYRDKDYAGEAAFVASSIRGLLAGATRVLELGCGTGAHAQWLAGSGFSVHGVDMSRTMLARAEERKRAMPAAARAKLTFQCGDATTVRTGEKYDAVISLFHVLSYQTTEAQQRAMLETAAAHLRPGGVFLFDFWYRGAVLAQKPELRVKRLEDDAIKVTRIAEPAMDEGQAIVDVNYTVFIQEKATGTIEEVREIHRMRYFSEGDITRLAEPATWQGVRTFSWMQDKPLNDDTWAGCALALRR